MMARLTCTYDFQNSIETTRRSVTMEAALPRLRSLNTTRQVLRTASCAACASSPSTRSFSVLNRPPPNYPGHVPLTKVERASLAIGASFWSFFNPYRHGTTQIFYLVQLTKYLPSRSHRCHRRSYRNTILHLSPSRCHARRPNRPTYTP